MFSLKDPLDRHNNYSLSEIARKSGFKFRDIENRRLDWKTLGTVDVNKVIENQDYDFLEKITPKIIEAPMQSILGTAAIDPAVSSLFRLSQMSLQYMSFCQQFMSHTMFDLRKTFNHIQKKYSTLKHNYKCMEEQHYKAQERIQSLLEHMNGQQIAKGDQIINAPKPSSLYACGQCTKNFLTIDSLKSHEQRKHSVIEEKHELSDDNEKDENEMDNRIEPVVENKGELTTNIETNEMQEKEIPQINNNNNDGESNANCTVCSQKPKINSSSIAIQCEVNTISNDDSQEIVRQQDNLNAKQIAVEDKCTKTDEHEILNAKELNNELIQSAYETINELKMEIVNLKQSLEAKTCIEPPQLTAEMSVALKDVNIDKIEFIEQKFNAFEVMYMESQHQFIESFRNLDERQKVYMDNIQETIKEVVEKSLGQHETVVASNPIAVEVQIDNIEHNNAVGTVAVEDVVDKCEPKNIEQPSEEPEAPAEKPQPVVKPRKIPPPPTTYDSSSYSEEDQKKLICQAEIHSSNDPMENENTLKTKKKVRKLSKELSKEMAINEFEQRLRQLGVDADSTGLTTPRSSEVNQDMAEERTEMKKAHKSFESTRKKLKHDVDRIAKKKLVSASSVTSLSSASGLSDGSESDSQTIGTIKGRPKTASVQHMRKRNAKKVMNKLVENDIDENDIIDKMQLAQKAINSHRECIQQLLQTTTHSPRSLNKAKYSSSIATKESANNSGEIVDSGMNQYNKMPNVTTRRVVFFDMGEDS